MHKFLSVTAAICLLATPASAEIVYGQFTGTVVNFAFGGAFHDTYVGDAVQGTFYYDLMGTPVANCASCTIKTGDVVAEATVLLPNGTLALLGGTASPENTYEAAVDGSTLELQYSQPEPPNVPPLFFDMQINGPGVASGDFSLDPSWSLMTVMDGTGDQYGIVFNQISAEIVNAPEPATVAVFGIALLGLIGVRKRVTG